MNGDPRLTPARGDLAAAHLKGSVEAARFAEGAPRVCAVGAAGLYEKPDARSRRETELLFGEAFIVYDEKNGFAWGQAQSDCYVGYADAAALAAPGALATHRVMALRTLLFREPDVKAPVAQFLSFNAKIAALDAGARFVRTPHGYAIARHLAPIASVEPDYVATAERMLGLPYLWGGKGMHGIDCSGLVQIALEAAGIAAPRDSDLQEKALGRALGGDSELQRGDLVFWDGHVGLMRDGETLLHANAFHMAVAIEPLRDAAARIARDGGPITSIRRL